MHISVDDREEPLVGNLEFDDMATITITARVTGIREEKGEEGGEVRKYYTFEATMTKVEKENTSRRGALEKAMGKQLNDDPYFQARVVPA